MACNSNAVGKEFIFKWKIENFSYCCQMINSPPFVVHTIENTRWRLSLWPKRTRNFISFCLTRIDKNNHFASNVKVDFELAFLDASGLALTSRQYKWAFEKGQGFADVLNKEDTVQRSVYLPGDVLIVRCKIWRSDMKAQIEISARTIIGVHHRSFEWVIENFSHMKSDCKSMFVFKSDSEDSYQTFVLFLTGRQCCEERISINITPSDENIKLFTFQCHLLGANGVKVDCGQEEFFYDDPKKGENFALPFTKMELLENKNKFVPNDVLSLKCKYTISSGIALEAIEEIDLYSPSTQRKHQASPFCLSDNLKFRIINWILFLAEWFSFYLVVFVISEIILKIFGL